MHQDQHTFRIFLSSTFSDLKEERNALQQRVFPRLRDLAAEHDYRFQVIDLRWGVSAEASLDQQAMDICLREVARCQHITPRPNFLVILGDRYGWCPPPAHIPHAHFQQFLSSIPDPANLALLQEWYFLDENALPHEWRLKARQPGTPYVQDAIWQPIEARLHTMLASAAMTLPFPDKERLPYIASATEQEIVAGALSVSDALEHVLCFLRSIPDLPQHFDLPAFRTELATSLYQTYGNTPFDQHVKDLAKELLTSPSLTTAADFAFLLRSTLANTPKGTIEHEVVGFLHQMLVDFTAHDFINLNETDWSIDQAALASQNALKERLIRHLPDNIFTYQAHWAGACITNTHLEQLCNDVYNSLSALMLDQIEHPHPFSFIQVPRHLIQPDDCLDEEGFAHQRFAEERLQGFEGRTIILEKIAVFLKDPNQPLFAVVGEGGSGKSALIARAVQQNQLSHPSAVLIYRFIGSTASSSSIQNLLESLCLELSRRYEVNASPLPTEYSELVTEFARCLQHATAEKPLFLFLDSLDQLSDSQGARTLSWLPAVLPASVHILISTRPEGLLDHLQTRQAHIETLTGLTREEGDHILTHWLENAHRTLQSVQRQEVLDKFMQSDGNPLYLKLDFEEARLWTSQAVDPVETLTPTLDGIIAHNMLKRLEKEQNHGKMLVSHALGYLAASRHGLSEDELIDLLSRDFEVYSWFFKGSQHVPPDLLQLAVAHRPQAVGRSVSQDERAALDWLTDTRTPPESVEKFLRFVLTLPNGPRLPIVLWSRLSFDLAPYLSQRTDKENILMTFYHRELQDVAQSIILKDGQEQGYHRQLADYFGSHSRFSSRRIEEQPWQLAQSENWQGLYDLLTNTEMMNLIWEQKREDMLFYWTQIENNSPLCVTDGYRAILEDPSKYSAYTVLNIVRLMNELGCRQENTTLLEYLIEYYRESNDLHHLQVTLGYLAFILQTRGELLEALDLFKEQGNICRQINNRNGLSDALGNQGVILQRRGLYNDALLKFSEQETLCRQIGHRKGLASSLGNHALILQMHGRLNEAMALHDEEELILHEINDRNGLCRSLLNQANIFKLMGKADDALRLLEKSLDIAREQGNKDAIQQALGAQGEVYIKLGQFEKALHLCQEQEHICRSMQNMNDLVAALGNQAAVKLNQGKFEEALPLLDETEQLCIHLNNLPMLSMTLNNKAAVLDSQGRGSDALALFKQMEQISRKMSHMEGIIMSLVNQAVTNYRYKLAEKGIVNDLFEKALQLAHSHGYAALETQIKDIFTRIS